MFFRPKRSFETFTAQPVRADCSILERYKVCGDKTTVQRDKKLLRNKQSRQYDAMSSYCYWLRQTRHTHSMKERKRSRQTKIRKTNKKHCQVLVRNNTTMSCRVRPRTEAHHRQAETQQKTKSTLQVAAPFCCKSTLLNPRCGTQPRVSWPPSFRSVYLIVTRYLIGTTAKNVAADRIWAGLAYGRAGLERVSSQQLFFRSRLIFGRSPTGTEAYASLCCSGRN